MQTKKFQTCCRHAPGLHRSSTSSWMTTTPDRGNTNVTLRRTTSSQLTNWRKMTRTSRFRRRRFGSRSTDGADSASTNTTQLVSRVDSVSDMLNGSNARMPLDSRNSYIAAPPPSHFRPTQPRYPLWAGTMLTKSNCYKTDAFSPSSGLLSLASSVGRDLHWLLVHQRVE